MNDSKPNRSQPPKRPAPPPLRVKVSTPESCPNTGYVCPAYTGRCELIESSRHAQSVGVSVSQIFGVYQSPETDVDVNSEVVLNEALVGYLDGVNDATLEAVRLLSSAVHNNNLRNNMSACAGTIVTSSMPLNVEPVQ